MMAPCSSAMVFTAKTLWRLFATTKSAIMAPKISTPITSFFHGASCVCDGDSVWRMDFMNIDYRHNKMRLRGLTAYRLRSGGRDPNVKCDPLVKNSVHHD